MLYNSHYDCYNNNVEQKDRRENKTTYKFYLIMAMSTSILLVSPVFILGLFGYFLDKFFHTAPLFLICGGILGFISGIINVFRMMKLMQKRKVKAQASNVKNAT